MNSFDKFRARAIATSIKNTQTLDGTQLTKDQIANWSEGFHIAVCDTMVNQRSATFKVNLFEEGEKMSTEMVDEVYNILHKNMGLHGRSSI